MQTTTYLCIDIGGTKLCSGLSNGHTVWDVRSSPISKGRQPLLTQLHHCIHDKRNAISAVLIGCPGNFINDNIVAGSAQNLGTFPGEFDNFNLKSALAPDTDHPVAVFNDARAQMAGAYTLMKASVKGVTAIGYIGPGTGLGGGFAQIDTHGIHPVTDGHIFDICLHRPPGDPLFPTTDFAENLLSGRAFYERTGISARDAAATTPEKFKPVIQEFGYTMANLIRTLYTGTVHKPEKQQWTNSELVFVKTVQHYLIGGGLGTSHPFGEWMLTTACGYLQEWQLPITIHTIPDIQKAALIGLVRLYLG